MKRRISKMQTLILKTDDSIFDYIKFFLSAIPKDKIEIIDPFTIDFVNENEKNEILEILKDKNTKEIIEASKKSYQI